MNENDFQAKLGELMNQIDDLPAEQREHLKGLAEEAKNRHAKIRGTVKQLQESLDYLRLSVKYLVFDLEATRRDNEHLRKILGEQAREQDNNDNEPNG